MEYEFTYIKTKTGRTLPPGFPAPLLQGFIETPKGLKSPVLIDNKGCPQ